MRWLLPKYAEETRTGLDRNGGGTVGRGRPHVAPHRVGQVGLDLLLWTSAWSDCSKPQPHLPAGSLMGRASACQSERSSDCSPFAISAPLLFSPETHP